jgi:glycosyltransferase involved in cell wall biosynthesis
VPITAVVENQALGTEKTGLRRQYRELENLLDRQKLWAMLAMIVGVVLRIRWKFDVVISSGPPVSPHLAALAISRTHSAKWIMDFRDPWVGSRPVIPGDVTEWRLRFERAAQRRCLAGCERVVSTSTEISSMLHEKFAVECEKLFVVTNGYDWELAPQESVGRLDMLYAGSLYLNRNPFPLCMAVANLIKQPSVDPGKVRLVFAGHCDSFGGIDLRTWLRENRLDSVVDIVGRLSVDELKPLVEKSTVLVNFAQDQPLQIPGKTFESIGARRYLLVIAEDESATARLVRNANAGLVVSPAEEKELDSALRALYERFVEKKIAFVPDDQELSTYSRSAANVEFSKIVESCTS